MEKIKLLAINPGSTSVKYTLFEGTKRKAFWHFKKNKQKHSLNGSAISNRDYEHSLQTIMKRLKLNDLKTIRAFGVRVVHGGSFFLKPTRINKTNLTKLKTLSELAPLHNPPAVQIIESILKKDPTAKVIGVFDTAFHQTIPAVASLYAIPREYSQKYHIKKYGFHGIACQADLNAVKKKTGKIPGKVIVCHLGGGCSVTAIRHGKSADTSMGFTPMEGLMMMTRPGDLDDEVLGFLAKKLKKPISAIMDLLNERSGIVGITHMDDMKTVLEKAKQKDPWCRLAVDMFIYRLLKYVFAYIGVLGGADALIFSGGIGEGSALIRNRVFNAIRQAGLKPPALHVIHVDENEEIRRQSQDAL